MGNGKTDRKRQAPDPGNMLVVLYVGFVMSILFLAIALDSYAAVDGGADEGMGLAEIRQGALLFSADANGGKFIAASQLSQDVEIYISAMTARTMVR